MDIKQYTISPDLSVKEAIKAIDSIGKKVVLITDRDGKLLGIFSDGDMRRYILKNGDLSVAVEEVMNKHPVVFRKYQEIEQHKLNSKMVVYPLIDDDNKLMDAVFWNDEDVDNLMDDDLIDIPVVIMAGGKGTRLYPYTQILPKPLIPIGELTITERIIERFRRHGCKDFNLILNYKGNMIKAYFNEIEKDYNVDYTDEKEFLGTAGGLGLLKDKIAGSFFVSNCDTIIDANYSQIYEFHRQKYNKITLVCALRNITVPYGVITVDEIGEIKEMAEKPSISFLTNTGLYLLESDVLHDIGEGVFMNMTDLIEKYLNRGEKVGVYPISEKSWLDMGQLDELENMFKALGVK